MNRQARQENQSLIKIVNLLLMPGVIYGEERAMIEPSLQVDANANAVIGAAIEVHRVLGPGFLEAVYEEAMAVELGLRGIRFERQKPVGVSYKGRPIGEGRLDFFIPDSLIVELKAAEKLLPIHQAQLMSYLKATGYRLGLLINFHERLLKDGVRRVVLTAIDG